MIKFSKVLLMLGVGVVGRLSEVCGIALIVSCVSGVASIGMESKGGFVDEICPSLLNL